MWFIINRFILNFSRDYSLEFDIKSVNDGKQCNMYIKKLDPDLRNTILSMIYYSITGYDNKYSIKGEIISRNPIHEARSIASTIGCDNNTVYIQMTDYTYAEILNKLDFEIRKYYETHSQIDAINGNK